MNNIGLMGAAGSGKDTTAKILIRKLQEAGLETFETYSFARPLKEFTVDVFNIAPHIIEPTCPESRALRETVMRANYDRGTLEAQFADAITDMLELYAEANELTFDEMLAKLGRGTLTQTVQSLYLDYRRVLKKEEYTPGRFMSILIALFGSVNIVRFNTSPRILLQLTGTEFFRQHISQSFWTDVAPRRNVVYTDVRFANELDFVHANGGLVLKIVNKNQQVIANSAHASEQLVYTAAPDYTIEHDGVTFASIERAVDGFIATL